jgi:hypothetical protein
MTIQQLFDLASRKSYYSRSDVEVWQALSSAAKWLYLEILRENRGFFIKFDATTVVLAVGQEEYTLPADLTQLLRVRERVNASTPWKVVLPSSLNDPDFTDSQFAAEWWPGSDGPVSEFEYYGPYLDAGAAAIATQIQKFKIEPPPVDARAVELAYIAKFVEITGVNSPKTIPAEGDDAVLEKAVATLLKDHGDFEGQQAAMQEAQIHKVTFLQWVRDRQRQQVRQVRPYIEDMD